MKFEFSGFTFFERRTIKRVLKKAAKTLNQPFKLQVSLACVNAQTIRELNLTHRQTDKPTDVLSFPAVEFCDGKIVDFDALKSTKIFVGDIAVCREILHTQAEELGHSIQRELAFLILHGFLHLLGFDHETDFEAENMQQLSEKILSACGIQR